jgi:hypothetical protein
MRVSARAVPQSAGRRHSALDIAFRDLAVLERFAQEARREILRSWAAGRI